MTVKFEISNQAIYLFISVCIVLVLFAGVSAYNSGQPPNVMGHSAGEVKGATVFLSSPVAVLDETGAKNGASVSGDLDTKMTVDLSGVSGLPSGATGAILTVSSAFKGVDDSDARRQFFAWSSLPTISDLDMKSPYLVLEVRSGKQWWSGGEGDFEYASASNTITIPLTSGGFQLARRQQSISEDHGYSVVLSGYIV